MEDIKLFNLPEQTRKIIEPFLLDILTYCKEDIVSIYVTGSAVTKDFLAKHSDINILIIVKETKVPFLISLQLWANVTGKREYMPR